MEYTASDGWKHTHDVIVSGWQLLCDILTSSRNMWVKVAQQRGERIAYLEGRCAKLEQELAQKGKV